MHIPGCGQAGPRILKTASKGIADPQVHTLILVSAPGLYGLIMTSRKDEARQFRRWVTHEVLPSIQRTGGYIVSRPEETGEEFFARAVVLAHAKLAEQNGRIAALTAENTVLVETAGQQTRRALKAEADGAVVPAMGHGRGAAVHPADRRPHREPPATALRTLGEGGTRQKPCPLRPQSPARSVA